MMYFSSEVQLTIEINMVEQRRLMGVIGWFAFIYILAFVSRIKLNDFVIIRIAFTTVGFFLIWLISISFAIGP